MNRCWLAAPVWSPMYAGCREVVAIFLLSARLGTWKEKHNSKSALNDVALNGVRYGAKPEYTCIYIFTPHVVAYSLICKITLMFTTCALSDLLYMLQVSTVPLLSLTPTHPRITPAHLRAISGAEVTILQMSTKANWLVWLIINAHRLVGPTLKLLMSVIILSAYHNISLCIVRWQWIRLRWGVREH